MCAARHANFMYSSKIPADATPAQLVGGQTADIDPARPVAAAAEGPGREKAGREESRAGAEPVPAADALSDAAQELLHAATEAPEPEPEPAAPAALAQPLAEGVTVQEWLDAILTGADSDAKAPLLSAMRAMLGPPSKSELAAQVVGAVDADELADPGAPAYEVLDRAVGRCVRILMAEQVRVASELRRRASETKVTPKGTGEFTFGPSRPFRVLFCIARTLLKRHRPTLGHPIAAVRALKSSPWATAGGKGPDILPKQTILAGSQADFVGGLQGLIGLPSGINEAQWLRVMQEEHCEVKDGWGESRREWKTGNYQLTTTPRREFFWVLEARLEEGEQLQDGGYIVGGYSWADGSEIEQLRRFPLDFKALCQQAAKRMWDMLKRLDGDEANPLHFDMPWEEFEERFRQQKLNSAEILGIRLYSGPCFEFCMSLPPQPL